MHTQTLKEGNIFNQHALRAKYMWVHRHRSFPPAELFCCNTMPSLVRLRQFIPLVTPPGLIEQLRVTLEFGSTVIWFTRHSLDWEQDSLILQSGLKLFVADTSVQWKKVNNIWKFCSKKYLTNCIVRCLLKNYWMRPSYDVKDYVARGCLGG